MTPSVTMQTLLLLFATFLCSLGAVDGGKKGVIQITDENWKQMLEGEWLVEFYAPWCPACKSLAPTWDAVGDWAQDLDINVAACDVTEEAGLSGRFMITSLPSIYHVIDGVFRRYMGPRTENDIITFIEDRKFQEVEVISSWRAPNSFSMGVVSFIFKISMKVRLFHTVMTEEFGLPWWSTYGFVATATVLTGLLLGMVFHNVMTEKYGFPIWVTYGFLAIFTVAFGLMLGLILVFLTDCCCPQKAPKQYVTMPPHQQPPTEETIPEEDEERTKGDGDKGETNDVKEEGEATKSEEGEEEESTVRQRKTQSNKEEGK